MGSGPDKFMGGGQYSRRLKKMAALIAAARESKEHDPLCEEMEGIFLGFARGELHGRDRINGAIALMERRLGKAVQPIMPVTSEVREIILHDGKPLQAGANGSNGTSAHAQAALPAAVPAGGHAESGA